MTQDNIVKLCSTSTKGILYCVYNKEDSKKILYTGQISDDPKHCYCECLAYVHGLDCYHQKVAKKIMEVKIC